MNSNEAGSVDALLMSTLLSLDVPVERIRYTGEADTYITFQIINGQDDAFSDDDSDAYEHYYGADIYSKGNYIALLTRTKLKLKEAGFYNITVDAETYEKDTRFNHISLSFRFLEDMEE